MSIRVLLADDHELIRKGLCSLLEKESDIEVIGEAEDSLKMLDLVRELVPNIVIINEIMPKLYGMEATIQIVNELPNVKVIALSMNSYKPIYTDKFIREPSKWNRLIVTELLNMGASGYLTLGCPPKELFEAIRHVAVGGIALCPYVAQWATNYWCLSDIPDSLIDSLTGVEQRVLQLKCEGRSIKEIASELLISQRSVEANWWTMTKKLHDNHDIYTPFKCSNHSSIKDIV